MTTRPPHKPLQLADLLEFYQPVFTPGFQTIVSGKKEYNELVSSVTEPLPPKGQYFAHQKFYHRYLRENDNLLILDEPGTGKSCSVIGFIEQVINARKLAETDPNAADPKLAHLRRTVILCQGDAQIEEIRNQIICECSDGHYEVEMAAREIVLEERALTRKRQETTAKSTKPRIQKVQDPVGKRRKRIVGELLAKNNIEITTYTTFAHEAKRNYPGSFGTHEDARDINRMIEENSDTIYWIDEAHNLLYDDQSKNKEDIEGKETYEIIWKIFHLAKRCKHILTTATPMINYSREFRLVLNLILPMDKQLPQGYNLLDATLNDIEVLFPDLPKELNPVTRIEKELNLKLPKKVDTFTYSLNQLIGNHDIDLSPIASDMAPYFQGQIVKNFDFNKVTLKQLEPYLRGRIGFIRAADTGAKPVDQGTKHEEKYTEDGITYVSQLVLYKSTMSKFQSEAYDRANTEQGSKSYSLALRQASNIVFPDGNWGTGNVAKKAKGKTRFDESGAIFEDMEDEDLQETTSGSKKAFAKFIFKNDNGQYEGTPAFKKQISTLAGIRKLSCKFAAIIEKVTQDPGNCFVYSESIKAGVIPLGLCLESFGFTRYDRSTSIFVKGKEGRKPYCATSGASNKQIDPQFKKQLRYCILTGDKSDTSEAQFKSMIETMNSYENRHGEYIKVFISGKKGREGLNIKNVLQIHLTEPSWNPSNMFQAKARGLRATSHVDLLKEEKIRMEAVGEKGEPKIEVAVYNHCAIPDKRYTKAPSIDLKLYLLSEVKDREIRRVMRMLKQASIGCQIQYKRNVRATDVDGSPTCDYDQCQYVCVNPKPKSIDYSTYDVVYAGEAVDAAIPEIKELFTKKNSYSIQELKDVLPTYHVNHLIMALERLITSKTQILDKFGFANYIREVNGTFFISQEYPSDKAMFAMSYYSQGLIAVREEGLPEIAKRMGQGRSMKKILDLERIEDFEELRQRLNDLSLEERIILVEETIKRVVEGNETNFTDKIMDYYQKWIFRIPEITEDVPVEEPKKKGRKKKVDTEQKTKRVKDIHEVKYIKPKEGAHLIYFHTLNSLIPPKQKQTAAITDYMKAVRTIRMLDENTHEWRDLNKLETSIYNPQIQVAIITRFKPYVQKQVYGFSIVDTNKFYIVDQRVKTKEDFRSNPRGQVCGTWDLPKLLDVMYWLEIDAPNEDKYSEQTSRADFFPEKITKKDKPMVLKTLEEAKVDNFFDYKDWEWKKLVYFYKWIVRAKSKKKVKEMMCMAVKDKLVETDRFIY
jgi:hypothetical protein